MLPFDTARCIRNFVLTSGSAGRKMPGALVSHSHLHMRILVHTEGVYICCEDQIWTIEHLKGDYIALKLRLHRLHIHLAWGTLCTEGTGAYAWRVYKLVNVGIHKCQESSTGPKQFISFWWSIPSNVGMVPHKFCLWKPQTWHGVVPAILEKQQLRTSEAKRSQRRCWAKHGCMNQWFVNVFMVG